MRPTPCARSDASVAELRGDRGHLQDDDQRIRDEVEQLNERRELSQPEPLKVRANDFVAFACGLFELLPFQHPNSPVPDPDESAIF